MQLSLIRLLLGLLLFAGPLLAEEPSRLRSMDSGPLTPPLCQQILSSQNLGITPWMALYNQTLPRQAAAQGDLSFPAPELLSPAVQDSLRRLQSWGKDPEGGEKVGTHLLSLAELNYPYLPTLKALGQSVFFAETGLALFESGPFPPDIGKQLRKHGTPLNELNDSLDLIERGNRKRVFYLPTFQSLSFEEINKMLAANLHPLGLSYRTVRVDGIRLLPVGLFFHDADHSGKILESQLKSPIPYGPEEQAQLSEFFLHARTELSTPENYLVQAMIFLVTHEDGRSFAQLKGVLEEDQDLFHWVKISVKEDLQHQPQGLELSDKKLEQARQWLLRHFPALPDPGP